MTCSSHFRLEWLNSLRWAYKVVWVRWNLNPALPVSGFDTAFVLNKQSSRLFLQSTHSWIPESQESVGKESTWRSPQPYFHPVPHVQDILGSTWESAEHLLIPHLLLCSHIWQSDDALAPLTINARPKLFTFSRGSTASDVICPPPWGVWVPPPPPWCWANNLSSWQLWFLIFKVNIRLLWWLNNHSNKTPNPSPQCFSINVNLPLLLGMLHHHY